ncbi:MAG: hypothetical protein EOO09_10075 [Chitinophagaceae bacterium]|nr:MAG: hypothetical protein EOO09_10075 [Chitinophagaceae bacterium]
MKRIILLGMLLPLFASSQKIAVIDPKLQKPVTYVSKVSMNHLVEGCFVVDRDNINNVMEGIRAFRALIDDKKDIPDNMKSVIKGSTYFTASGDKGNYSIVLDTKIDKQGTYFILVNKKDSRKENLESIDNFLAYLDKAK